MKKNRLVLPVVKWVGGKRQLLEEFKPLFPKIFHHIVNHFWVEGLFFLICNRKWQK